MRNGRRGNGREEKKEKDRRKLEGNKRKECKNGGSEGGRKE